MKFFLLSCLVFGLLASVGGVANARPLSNQAASFPQFDQRARKGEPLNVVFFGASLTWGANSSNPIETSYRADTARKFEAAYPKAHFHFYDAAIGGTGSQLGVFRMARDVFRHQPDLVFLDFSANDDIYGDDEETLSSYESLVRRLVLVGVSVVQVVFPFRWNADKGASELPKMKRRTAHLAIARAYNTGVGDAVELAIQRVGSSQTTLDALWPYDGIHPGDRGYELFSDAAFTGFQSAVHDKRVCQVPARMLYAPTYMNPTRARISQLGALPSGWSVSHPNLVSAYFDFLMSRWLDDEVVVSNRQTQTGANGTTATVPQQLKLGFRGSMVMLFGECTLKSGKYRAYLDGQLVTRQEGGKTLTEFDPGAFARTINGNGHHVQVIAQGLNSSVEHTLEIEPLFDPAQEQELRFESVCVAGASSPANENVRLSQSNSAPTSAPAPTQAVAARS